MRCLKFVAAIAVATCYGSASGVTIRNDAATGDSSAYPSAGALNGNGPNNGVLIDNRFVLTAAHVVFGLTPASFTFIVGGLTYNVDQININPLYNNNNLAAGNDAAVLRLTQAVPTPLQNATNGVNPAKLYTGTAELGQTATILGQGQSGNGTSGGLFYPGSIRSATNVLDQAGGLVTTSTGTANISPLVLLFDFDSPPNSGTSNHTGTATPTALEGSIAQNDSGGGSFVTLNSTTFLAGIHSFVIDADGSSTLGNYFDVAGDTRVSSQISFINSVVPEPTSMSLVALAGLGLLAQRRRRMSL